MTVTRGSALLAGRATRRGGIALLVLLLWGVGLAALVRRELFRPRTERLAEAALRITPGAMFYGVFQGDRQIGFASSTIDTTAREITVAEYLVADLTLGGRRHRAEARTNVTMTRALRVTHFSVGMESGGGPFRASGQISGDTLLVLVTEAAGAPADTQAVRLAGPILLPTLVPLAVVLGDDPEVGRSTTLPLFDPVALAPRDVAVRIAAESLFVLADSASFDSTSGRWLPERQDTVRAWQLQGTGSSAVGGWVDEQGRIVEAAHLGTLTLRRLPYELAFENWRIDLVQGVAAGAEARDILETTAIAAGRTLDRPRPTRLRVRLRNVDLAGFDLDGGRQRLAGDTLTVVREDEAALRPSYALGREIHSRFPRELAAEPLIQSRHPAIALRAVRIAGLVHDPRLLTEKLTRWVHDSIAKEMTFGIPSALQVLQTGRGDCNEHTQLYVAFARALGIPARVAAGLVYVDGKFYYHAWPEVYLSDWVAVDPTFGQYPADAAHLRFTVGGLDRQAELLRLIGNLDIDVLEAR